MEDRLLIWKLNRGSKEALCRVYEKYRDDLVRIAAGLVNDVSAAEDIVQEVFVTLVHSAGKNEIRRNLKGYLISCVVNKIRNLYRTKASQGFVNLSEIEPAVSNLDSPDEYAACDEVFKQLYRAIAGLPYEQKEVVLLHIQGKLKFREIAKLQNVSIKTVLSRYNYGLTKLRSLLNGEVEK